MWGVGTPNALKATIITTIMNPIKGNKKDEEKKIINEAAGEEYKYGFVTDVETAVIPKGLNEDVVRQISALKGEPEWLLEFRLKAFRHWLTLPQPKWGHVNIPDIDFQDISYYAAPRKRTPQKEIDPEVKKTFDKLGIPLEEQMRLSGMAVDAIMDSVSVHTTYREKLAELGVIFCSISEAVKDYPDLVKKYMGTVVPYTDNFYAALNSAVFSDGSFVYIPKGVRCPMELSSYFRINAAQTGQFERTLIVADDDSYVSYLEGCTAPQRDENQLHAAIVEIIVEERAEVKYSTVQNWYPRRQRRPWRYLQPGDQAWHLPWRPQQTLVDAGGNRLGYHLEIPKLHSGWRQHRGRVLLRGAHPQSSRGRHWHQDDSLGQEQPQHHRVERHFGWQQSKQLPRYGENCP